MAQDERYKDRTLIIVDNFNVMFDKKFSEFTSGDYKVIFTSREKHEGRVAYEVRSMEENDLIKLFCTYYTAELAAEDESAVKEIIRLIRTHNDGHAYRSRNAEEQKKAKRNA